MSACATTPAQALTATVAPVTTVAPSATVEATIAPTTAPTVVPTAATPASVTDSAGRVVAIPAHVNKIISSGPKHHRNDLCPWQGQYCSRH
jgi:ABC-type Fe3+-hydroxamate transport system substrate-binding protein